MSYIIDAASLPGFDSYIRNVVDEYFYDIGLNYVVTHEWLRDNEHELTTYISGVVCAYNGPEHTERH